MLHIWVQALQAGQRESFQKHAGHPRFMFQGGIAHTKSTDKTNGLHLFLLDGGKSIREEGKGLPRRVDHQGWPGETSLRG